MTTATEMLNKYIDAETAILEGQTVSFNGRSYSMANLKDVQDGRAYWQKKVNAETNSTNKVRTAGGVGYSVARFDR